MKALDFFQSIGLTDAVTRWLQQNAGEPLREEIVGAVMAAINAGLPAAELPKLRGLIAKIPTVKI